MATILPWPRHQLVKWESIGGCLVCRTWEGEMPTDCPGRETTEEERSAILTGELDYRRSEGGWTTFTRAKWLRAKMICEEN